jgi:hypothetical protein
MTCSEFDVNGEAGTCGSDINIASVHIRGAFMSVMNEHCCQFMYLGTDKSE